MKNSSLSNGEAFFWKHLLGKKASPHTQKRLTKMKAAMPCSNISLGIRLFLNQVLIRKKIPFEIESKESITRKNALENFYALRAEAKNLQKMSLDEINTEI